MACPRSPPALEGNTARTHKKPQNQSQMKTSIVQGTCLNYTQANQSDSGRLSGLFCFSVPVIRPLCDKKKKKNTKQTHGKLCLENGVLTVYFGFYGSAYRSIFQMSVADASVETSVKLWSSGIITGANRQAQCEVPSKKTAVFPLPLSSSKSR